MAQVTFNTPVIKIPGLETKFDTTVVSNSFVAFIGDYIEARIVQQLHYWSYSEYGVIINGLRWIYKPIREWLSESFVGFTSWQLRKAIASLVEKRILLKEHLFKEHHGNNFAPKNRTFYYSVNYARLEELAEERETAETTENHRFVSPTEQFCENSEKQFCNTAKNRTKNTYIKNGSKDLSHPHHPCVCKTKKEISQEQEFSNPKPSETEEIDSVNSKAIKKDTNASRVEQSVNQCKSTIPDVASVSKPKPKKTQRANKPKRESKAPWKDEGEFKQFYRALIQALPIVANARSSQGLAQVIIRQLRSGIPHSYWDDFAAGLPIGTTDKPEWEVEPGVPYPMFIEYLTEKIIRGNNTQTTEQARNEVFRILEKPRQAKAFWGQFKRSVVNVAETVKRDRALGVNNPNTPVWTRERIEPSVEEAAAAGQKIQHAVACKSRLATLWAIPPCAVNGVAQTAIEGVKTPQLESTPIRVQAHRAFLPDERGKGTQRALDKSRPSEPDPWTDKSESEPKPSSKEDKPESEPDAQRSGAYAKRYPLGNPLGRPSLREMLEARGVKGFCKPMPKVSRAEAEAEAKAESEAIKRQQMNYKTHLNQMSLDEINELLKDPISRTELTPQLIDSNYELITDYLGQIIRVKLSELQIREKRSQKLEE